MPIRPGDKWIDPRFVTWKVLEVGNYTVKITANGITVEVWKDRIVKGWTKVMPDKGQM